MTQTRALVPFMFAAVMITFGTAHAGVRTALADGPRRPLAPQIASGGDSEFGIASCQVNGDSTVRCWGKRRTITRSGSGSTFIPFNSPVAISGVTNAIAIALGRDHACVLQSSGTVVCWGANSSGQLGLGQAGSATFGPTPVPNLTGVVSIAAGGDDTCAILVDGTARCWGANQSGQIGNSATSTPVASPTQVLGLSGLVGIATSGSHTCALSAHADVRCWGRNNDGEVTGTPSTAPQLDASFVLTDSLAVDVSVASGYSCAVLFDGTGRCWGSNRNGQLGAGFTDQGSHPVSTISGLSGAVGIATANDHACALIVDGSAACWGSVGSGAVNGTPVFNTVQPIPVPVPNTGDGVAVAAGASVSCLHRSNDSWRCWGDLGMTSPEVHSSAVLGSASISGQDVAAGGSHSCARRAQATVACWGANDFGQLGIGTFVPSPGTPVTPALNSATNVTTGDLHTCARKSNGLAVCWGKNDVGQAGDTPGGPIPSPLSVVDRYVFDPIQFRFVAVPLSQIRSIDAGANHSCAALVGGSVACWGANDSGQLGNGTTNPAAFPFLTTRPTFVGESRPVAVAVGASHSCALGCGGDVRCWGGNTHGEVTGTPTSSPQTTPVAPALTPPLPSGQVVAISAADFHTCALLVNGSVRCWGSSNSGRLGDGSVVDAVAVSAGGAHTCIVRAGGTAQCWGGNLSGALGNGTFSASTSPVTVQTVTGFAKGGAPIVASLANLVSISAGGLHTCAVRSDGEPFCWGRNATGQVDTTLANANRAIAEPSFLVNVDPSVTLDANGRVAHVTALANCPAGDRVQIQLSLEQNDASGFGVGDGECTGGLAPYEITVSVHGPGAFAVGPAVANADAEVRDRGNAVDTEHWTRAVQISLAP